MDNQFSAANEGAEVISYLREHRRALLFQPFVGHTMNFSSFSIDRTLRVHINMEMPPCKLSFN